MRIGEARHHDSAVDAAAPRFAHDDARRTDIESLVAAGWTWVEAVEALAHGAPAAWVAAPAPDGRPGA